MNPIILIRDWYLTRIKWKKHSFGKKFHAGRNVILGGKRDISIGYYCYLGAGTSINSDALIGNYVFTANNVAFVGKNDHLFNEIGKPILMSSRFADLDYPLSKGKNLVTIEDDVWIGYGSILMSGITIGQGSIIAAGAVVTSDVEPFSIYGGVPAKKIGNRFSNENDKLKHIELYKKNYLISLNRNVK